MRDKSIQMIHEIPPAENEEGICTGLCYSKAPKAQDFVESKLYYDDYGNRLLATIRLAYTNIHAVELMREMSIYMGILLICALLFFNLLVGLFLRAFRKQMAWTVGAVRSLARGDVPDLCVASITPSEFDSALNELGVVLMTTRHGFIRVQTERHFSAFPVRSYITYEHQSRLWRLDLPI